MPSPKVHDEPEHNIKNFIRSITNPGILIPNLIGGGVLAIMNIATALSIGALIFSGALRDSLGTGIGLFLVGTAIGGLLVPIGSGYHAIISGPRSGQAPIFAVMAASIAVSMQAEKPEAVVATVVVAILTATLVSGALMIFFGMARLGNLARYIPYPVMGGFFAGLGFLLFKGGVSVAIGPVADVNEPVTLLSSEVAILLIPALLFGGLLVIVESRVRHWLVMPVLLIVSLLIFYGILFIAGQSVEAATAANWLPNIAFEDSGFLPVITIEGLGKVNWSAILLEFDTIIILAVLSVVMLLLDVAGVEIIINRELEPNKELRSAGISNVVGGLLGSPLAFAAAADTALAHKLGARRFVSILFYTIIIVAAVLVGPAPVGYVPSFILGGLLVYIGMNFLIEWLWQSYSKLPLSDFLIICLILLMVVGFGILEGFVAGIAISVILFVHRYSQLSIIKVAMTGNDHASNIDRHPEDQTFIDEHADLIRIFVLQGFIFFGSATRLSERIKSLLEDPDRDRLRFLLMDFRRVDAMDTSAINSFAKLMQLCDREDLSLVLTGCTQEIRGRLERIRDGLDLPSLQVRFFSQLDIGRGWCDDQILQSFDRQKQNATPSAASLLEELLESREAAVAVEGWFERLERPKGDYLFHQGDTGDALFILAQGRVSIHLELEPGKSINIRTLRAGAILGEMSLYTGAPRSASARAKEDSVLYRLTRQDYLKLQADHPHAAGAFNTFIVRLLSERLQRANREVLALSR